MKENALLSRTAAAEWLAERLNDKSVEQWVSFLRSNANSARKAIFRIKTEKLGRETFYKQDELQSFFEFEKSRNVGKLKLSGRAASIVRAFGLGAPGSSGYGRKWFGGEANDCIRENGLHFVQAVIDEPFLAFALKPEDAIEFGKKLMDAGKSAQNRNNARKAEAAPDLSNYETIADNADVLIQRRKNAN
jgi:hypothetical protein